MEDSERDPAEQKYVVCNAEESEPGAGKDGVILSGDPHAVIEGMAICGVAVGADKGFICIRAEYRQVREMLKKPFRMRAQTDTWAGHTRLKV